MGIGDAVPPAIELGYHLCYGSPADEHLVQPKDAGIMVEMTNAIAAEVKRPIQFFHLPVPKPRSDDAYFAPLEKLKLGRDTELYLGLIHYDDAAGNAARLAAARRHARVDGVATECGMAAIRPGCRRSSPRTAEPQRWPALEPRKATGSALVANIAATKKLMIIDTCQAEALGNALQVALLTRGMDDATALKILSRATGTTVLAASTSNQQALEGYEGHGLFTHVVAEGLKAEGDVDKDGFVSTLGLAHYVDGQVPKLGESVFKHAQYPSVEMNGAEFPVTKVT